MDGMNVLKEFWATLSLSLCLTHTLSLSHAHTLTHTHMHTPPTWKGIKAVAIVWKVIFKRFNNYFLLLFTLTSTESETSLMLTAKDKNGQLFYFY